MVFVIVVVCCCCYRKNIETIGLYGKHFKTLGNMNIIDPNPPLTDTYVLNQVEYTIYLIKKYIPIVTNGSFEMEWTFAYLSNVSIPQSINWLGNLGNDPLFYKRRV